MCGYASPVSALVPSTSRPTARVRTKVESGRSLCLGRWHSSRSAYGCCLSLLRDFRPRNLWRHILELNDLSRIWTKFLRYAFKRSDQKERDVLVLH